MTLFDLFRILHIIAGFTALFLFWIPIIVKKGGTLHRIVGWIYVWAMGTVAVSAFYMGVNRIFFDSSSDQERIIFSWFLMYISILSAAAAWYGIRVLRFKRKKAMHNNIQDLSWSILLVASSVAISVYGFWVNASLLAYFPAVGFFLGIGQLSYWLRKPKLKGQWYIEHLVGMLSCCISTITAFVVFGAPSLLNIESVSIVLWLAPTILLTPVIIGFSSYYSRKFNKKTA
ncbi:hypothetical protein J416_11402 [Gracilibacillus halophilus YIM-C55.5]|uniref:DUF2306 domain-containing protein n=1 Tax=Gracilibacillus halophilus YIM-C55.5 TaxID=1308866 RepID=N4WPB8_9BACI|nr:hypothetical protein [Gracilibacillus halophilus]ENH96330.1 hypothetical protein J416_11402 [Gracilibacillus halophilus YIM-C55.5]